MYESIAKLSGINSNDTLKIKKENRKEKRLNQELERVWNDKQSQKFWTSQMKLIECPNSIYRFHPSKGIN